MPDITGCWGSNQAMPRRPNITIHKRSVKGLRLGYGGGGGGGGVFWIVGLGYRFILPPDLCTPHTETDQKVRPLVRGPHLRLANIRTIHR